MRNIAIILLAIGVIGCAPRQSCKDGVPEALEVTVGSYISDYSDHFQMIVSNTNSTVTDYKNRCRETFVFNVTTEQHINVCDGKTISFTINCRNGKVLSVSEQDTRISRESNY